MANRPMEVSEEDFRKVQDAINDAKECGSNIRGIFEGYYKDDIDIDWEVEAAVGAFSVFSSKWTIEILATLYVGGERRFYEMGGLVM